MKSQEFEVSECMYEGWNAATDCFLIKSSIKESQDSEVSDVDSECACLNIAMQQHDCFSIWKVRSFSGEM